MGNVLLLLCILVPLIVIWIWHIFITIYVVNIFSKLFPTLSITWKVCIFILSLIIIPILSQGMVFILAIIIWIWIFIRYIIYYLSKTDNKKK